MGSLSKTPDFDRLAKAVLGKSKNGRIPIIEFRKSFPEVYLQIRKAAESPFLDHWGQSKNVDENTGTRIVDPKILSVIGRIAKARIRFSRAYHSGLLHTFGYLFSLLQTPYGLKRDRWIDGVIEKGLGLVDRWLFPIGQESFFDRVSELLAIIAWNGIPTRRTDQFQFSDELVNALRRLKTTRIVEHPSTESSDIKKAVSDLVWFRKPVSNQNALLVYSIHYVGSPLPSLQTCFPVTKSAADELIDSTDDSIAELRYNSVCNSIDSR